MKKLIVLLVALHYAAIAYSQNIFKAIIKDVKNNEVLIGATATVQGTAIGASADTSGLVNLTRIPDGTQIIRFGFVGYQTLLDTITFPLVQNQPLIILLQPAGNGEGQELTEVVVGATRSSRTIANIPTRVEVIS